ncbi:hypothetical protein RN001_007506 [Aquatica leii]|uniref:Uncharacterized protein n=1 Tax=Aquatica leii TaxID=1421715 RepID=A0AAN7SQY5_9COLE|nr:hypothetical protein RN001_007506 [Aquatica leii]
MFAQLFILTISAYVVFGDTNKVPPYVKQCKESDPQLLDCLIGALQHLSPYLATGIKEIELPTVEPFQMDELTLSLTTGPNGYKVSLLDIDIFGASNYTVKKIKLSENGKPFQAIINIPELRINAKYRSTGVLIILPASGNGTFHAKFKNVTAVVQGQISVNYKGDLKYLHVDTLNLDLDVKDAQMGVKKIYRNNRILIEAINLFLRENGQEVLKAMTPQLKKKLSTLFQTIANQLLTHIPMQTFLISGSSS